MNRKEKREFYGGTLEKFTNESGNKNQACYFNSLADYIKAVDHLKSSGNLSTDYVKDNGKEWALGKHSIEETSEHLIMGLANANTLKEVEIQKQKYYTNEAIQFELQTARSIKKKRKYGESGSELDIDRVLCGDPEHWQYMTKGRNNSVVKIGLNVIITAGDAHETFYKLVALAILATDMVVSAGFSCELYCIAVGKRSNSGYSESGLIIPIKRAEEDIDVNKIASTGFPGFMRYYTHSAISEFFDGEGNGGWYVEPMTQEYKAFLELEHLIQLDDLKQDKDIAFLKNILNALK